MAWSVAGMPGVLVLNAFRHHRGRHTIGIAHHDITNKCSTPFGITEVGTAAPAAPAVVSPVLNAFRHHRGRHILAVICLGVCILCSTPFGITEVGTRVGSEPVGVGSVCSTPFGITEVGTRRGRPIPRRARVLNAFRHHRGRHLVHCLWAHPDKMCSTPFGITEVGTPRPGRSAGWPPRVLNAFRHHRGRHKNGAAASAARSRAQRLSASQRSAPPAPSPARRHRASAQRLSASQRSAHRISSSCRWSMSSGAQRLSASQRSAPAR